MITNRYNYSLCDREYLKGERKYVTPDGSKLTSVTTILNATKTQEQKQALIDWKKRVGEVKAQEISTTAASRGTRMHSFLEHFIKNDELKNPGTNPFSIQSHKMAQLIIDNAFPNISESWGVEVSLYYPELYAGTTDYSGVWKGKPAIMDFKQSNKPKKKEWIGDYFMQTAAYSAAHNEIYKTDINTGVVLICTADYQYQEFVIEGDEFKYWTNQWYDRVAQYYNV